MIRVTVKLFLLFILVYAGVYLWYDRLEKRLVAPPQVVSPQTASAKPVEKTKQVSGKTSNYQTILTRNIFEAVLEQKDVEPKNEEPEKVVEKEPEETTLKLVLHGTVSGTDRDARAIIVDQKEKRQDIYQIGDAIQDALITSIERGKVVLEVNGRKQLLLIKDPEGGGGKGSVGGPTGPVFAPRQSTPARKPSGSVLPRKDRTPAPTAVPHRRISFRQDRNEDKEAEPAEYEEPEEPLVEEDLEENVELPEGENLGPGNLESEILGAETLME